MSYATVYACAHDQEFEDRLQACIAQEQEARGEDVMPSAHLETMRWTVAGSADVEAAYASALAGGNPSPGGDESVITDQMILSHVQAEWPEPAKGAS